MNDFKKTLLDNVNAFYLNEQQKDALKKEEIRKQFYSENESLIEHIIEEVTKTSLLGRKYGTINVEINRNTFLALREYFSNDLFLEVICTQYEINVGYKIKAPDDYIFREIGFTF